MVSCVHLPLEMPEGVDQLEMQPMCFWSCRKAVVSGGTGTVWSHVP